MHDARSLGQFSSGGWLVGRDPLEGFTTAPLVVVGQEQGNAVQTERNDQPEINVCLLLYISAVSHITWSGRPVGRVVPGGGRCNHCCVCPWQDRGFNSETH